VVVFLAVLKLGGICTTVNPLYTAQELAKQLVDANAKIIVTVSAFLDKAKTAAQTHPVQEIIVIDTETGYRNLKDLMQANHELSEPSISPKDDFVRTALFERHYWIA
jgi:acyl-coenzyme A synthetase/AMP-(fatty) acid ligase